MYAAPTKLPGGLEGPGSGVTALFDGRQESAQRCDRC